MQTIIKCIAFIILCISLMPTSWYIINKIIRKSKPFQVIVLSIIIATLLLFIISILPTNLCSAIVAVKFSSIVHFVANYIIWFQIIYMLIEAIDSLVPKSQAFIDKYYYYLLILVTLLSSSLFDIMSLVY